MNYIALLSCPLFLIGCAVSKTQKELDARTPTGATPVQVDTDDDLNFCYSMTGIAKNTVIKRNQGLLLENQQQQRKERFGEQSDIYILIDDFTRKVYSKKMTNSVESAINFHKSCIALQQPQMQYHPSALSRCPMAAAAIDMANTSKILQKSETQTVDLLKTNFPGFSNAFGGGYQNLVTNLYSGQSFSGLSYYKDCMMKNKI